MNSIKLLNLYHHQAHFSSASKKVKLQGSDFQDELRSCREAGRKVERDSQLYGRLV